MNFKRFAAAAALAIAGIVSSMAGAFAYEAAATTALNVRTGPGTGYPVIAALSQNQVVEVVECNASNSWCRVQAANIRGWASARYLRPLGSSTPSPQPPRPGSNADAGISIETPNFSFSIGSGNRSRSGEVCFYEGYDYRGRNFCADYGDQDRSLPNFWNDRIRSVRVEGNLSATVCTRTNFNGRCAVVDRSVRNLGMLADEISSFSIGDR